MANSYVSNVKGKSSSSSNNEQSTAQKSTVYTKGGITFRRDPSGKLERINKPSSINIGITKKSGGGERVVQPSSSSSLKRGRSTVKTSTYNVGNKKYFTENGRVVVVRDKKSGITSRIKSSPKPPSRSTFNYLDISKQSIDPNKLTSRSTKTIKDSKGNVWGYVDYANKQTVGFSQPIKEQDILRLEAKRQPKDKRIRVDVSKFRPSDAKVPYSPSKYVKVTRSYVGIPINKMPNEWFRNINISNNKLGLRKITPTILSKVIVPDRFNPNKSVVITKPISDVQIAKYGFVTGKAKDLAVNGFAVPSDVAFGFKAGLDDWKTALYGFIAGGGLNAVSRLTGKSNIKKVRSFSKLLKSSTAALGKVAVVFLIYDLGKEYGRLVAEGNSPAYSLSKTITTLGSTVGGAAVGSGAVSLTSKSTRSALSKAAKMSLSKIKKPSISNYKKIVGFLDVVNPVKPYQEIVLQPSFLNGGRIIRRIDPKTKKEIVTIINKLESIIKLGNSHVKLIKKIPSSRTIVVDPKLKPLPVDRSLVVSGGDSKAVQLIAKRYLTYYRRMLNVGTRKKSLFTRAQIRAFEKELSRMRKLDKELRKLDKGLRVKSDRKPSFIRDGKKVWQLDNLVTGKSQEFPSRKLWLKAVKEQIKLVDPSKSKVSKWLSVMNKKNVQPIYNKPKISSKEKERFINNLMREAAKLRKLDKGLRVKSDRKPSFIRDGKKVWQLDNLVTGKSQEFPSRKLWLKAVKKQIKMLNQGKISSKVSDKTLKDFFEIANLKFTVPKVRSAIKTRNKIITLKDINKKTSVKKTRGGGVEVKAANGQVVVLETPQTVKKNKQVQKAVNSLSQSQQTKQMTQQLTVKLSAKKKAVIVKPSFLSLIKQFASELSFASKISPLISNIIKNNFFKKSFVDSSQYKKAVQLFSSAKVSSTDSAIISRSKSKSKSVNSKVFGNKKFISKSSRQKLPPQKSSRQKLPPRTINKLEDISKKKKKRPKTKFTKDEIKYMLSKIYVKGKYRPSLAALVFNITGFKAPKTLTGFEIRPILKKK